MKLRLVVLGMMGAYPFGGQTWLYVNWLTALRSLGHDVWYVEDNRLWQFDPARNGFTDDCRHAVEHVAATLGAIGLADRWMFRWSVSTPQRCWGGTVAQLQDLYASCDALLNVCVATELGDDHMAAPFRVWVETDPVVDELRLAGGDEKIRSKVAAHNAFATYGENYGSPDCPVPLHGIDFVTTRQPIDLDRWPMVFDPGAEHFTTIGNYRHEGFDLELDGETYRWSKHHEWERFKALPSLTAQPFQLALSADDDDRATLERQGWRLTPSLPMSLDAFGDYRRFIQGSRGEFTVAKDQNVRLRSGWFSERDACYLASGKPVVAQDTAFVLPRGDGLFGVADVDQAAAAIAEINRDYAHHCRAARQLAEEHLAGPRVAARLLSDLGLE